MRKPEVRVTLEPGFGSGLVVDNFAGGGGASTGIEAAIGRPCDIAINHDQRAIAMHIVNHPKTRHYTTDIWNVRPKDIAAGRQVDLVWLSPDCKHFSKAKGAAPRDSKIRGLAWIALPWAALGARIIVLENVEEFATWGPLDSEGTPIKEKAGATFDSWVRQMQGHGYTVEFRSLVAADYGAPTIRKRMFVICRRDRQPIVWPTPTHNKDQGTWNPVHKCINWDHPTRSIFNRKKPLAQPTMNRIAKGIERYVINDHDPFIVRHGHYSKRTGAGIEKGKGAGLFRGQSIRAPLATVCATNDKNIIIPHIIQNYGGMVGYKPTRPLGTITQRDSSALAATHLEPAQGEDRSEQVSAFLTAYYGSEQAGQSVKEPLRTITSKARFGLVTLHGVDYRIVDIHQRMLQPDELYLAQGFPADYKIDADSLGLPFTQTEQTRMVGNSVCPPVAEALVREAVRKLPMAIA